MVKKTSSFKKLALNFTNRVLDNYKPDNMCFTVSFPLSLHLANYNFKNTIRAGRFYDDSIKDGTPHFWIKLDSEIENIIDPTAKQFYPNLTEPICFMEKPKYYRELSQSLKKEWFAYSYDKWSKGLLNHDEEDKSKSIIPIQALQSTKNPDIKTLLDINLRAAAILNTDCEKLNLEQSILHKKYFECIYRVIQKFHDKEEMKKLNLPNEFQSLLNKVLNNSSSLLR